MESIQEQIKSARVNSGLTQEQLGDKIGVTRQQITRYEIGTSTPTLCTLSKIQKVLKFQIKLP